MGILQAFKAKCRQAANQGRITGARSRRLCAVADSVNDDSAKRWSNGLGHENGGVVDCYHDLKGGGIVRFHLDSGYRNEPYGGPSHFAGEYTAILEGLCLGATCEGDDTRVIQTFMAFVGNFESADEVKKHFIRLREMLFLEVTPKD